MSLSITLGAELPVFFQEMQGIFRQVKMNRLPDSHYCGSFSILSRILLFFSCSYTRRIVATHHREIPFPNGGIKRDSNKGVCSV